MVIVTAPWSSGLHINNVTMFVFMFMLVLDEHDGDRTDVHAYASGQPPLLYSTHLKTT